MNPQPVSLTERITECLARGGLFNMEVMEAGKVRDVLIDCRNALLVRHAVAEPQRCICGKPALHCAEWPECIIDRSPLTEEDIKRGQEVARSIELAAHAAEQPPLAPSDYICPRCKRAVPENAPCPYCPAPPAQERASDEIRICPLHNKRKHFCQDCATGLEATAAKQARLDEARWWNAFVIHMHPVLQSQTEPCVLCNHIAALAAQPSPQKKETK